MLGGGHMDFLWAPSMWCFYENDFVGSFMIPFHLRYSRQLSCTCIKLLALCKQQYIQTVSVSHRNSSLQHHLSQSDITVKMIIPSVQIYVHVLAKSLRLFKYSCMNLKQRSGFLTNFIDNSFIFVTGQIFLSKHQDLTSQVPGIPNMWIRSGPQTSPLYNHLLLQRKDTNYSSISPLFLHMTSMFNNVSGDNVSIQMSGIAN